MQCNPDKGQKTLTQNSQKSSDKPRLGRVWGLGFRVWGLGFGVWGLGFGVWGFGGLGVWGFGVWGLGFGL